MYYVCNSYFIFTFFFIDYTQAIGEESSGSTPSELKLRCKYRRALAYFEMQKYDEVVKDTNQILHLDPNSVQARALLGRALKVLNDHKKAEEQLSIAVLLDATQANLYIGNAYPIDFNMKQRLILFFLLVYVTVCLSVCLSTERGDIRFRTAQRVKVIEAIYGTYAHLEKLLVSTTYSWLCTVYVYIGSWTKFLAHSSFCVSTIPLYFLFFVSS